MSDFGATDPSGKIDPISRQSQAVERPNKVAPHSKDGGTHTEGQSKGKTDSKAQGDQMSSGRSTVRDPAVSIDASVAHVKAGDVIRETVRQIDSSGRPLIDTKDARFALRPDAELKVSDQIELRVTSADRRIEAELVSKNNQPVTPPLSVQLVVITTHASTSAADQPAQNQLEKTPVAPTYTAPKQAFLSTSPQQPLAVYPAVDTNPQAAASTIAASMAENAEKIMLGLQALSQEKKKSIADFLTLMPQNTGASHSKASMQAVEDPLLLKTSSEDMKTILALQSEAGISKKMAVLSHLDSMPRPAARVAFQGMPLAVHSLPHLLSVQPAGAQAGDVAQRILAQVPVPEAGLKAFGLNQQSLTHPVYQLVTTKGDFLAALPEMMDLRGLTVSVKPLLPTVLQATPAVDNPASTPSQPNSDGIKGLLISPTGERAVAQLGASVAADNSYVSQPVTVKSITPMATQSGQVTHTLETSLGRIAVSLPSDQPLPFKVGDSLPITILTAGNKIGSVTNATQTPTPAASSGASPLPPAPLQSLWGWPAMNSMMSEAATLSPTVSEEMRQLTALNGDSLSTATAYMLAAGMMVKEAGGTAGLETDLIAKNLLPQALATALQNKEEGRSLIDQFVRDIIRSTSQVIAPETQPNQWRGMALPVDPRDASLSLFAFLFKTPEEEDYSQRGQGQNDEENPEKGRKEFILQVDFSELGPLQVKGSLYPDQLILRIETLSPLPESLRQELENLYQAAVNADGIEGNLAFASVEKFEVSAKSVLGL